MQYGVNTAPLRDRHARQRGTLRPFNLRSVWAAAGVVVVHDATPAILQEISLTTKQQTIAHTLFAQTAAAKNLLAQYATILGEDDVAKSDLVEGETNLHEAIERAAVRIIEIDALEASLKDVISGAQKRLKRLQDQRDLLRTSMAVALEVAGQKRIETAIATISLRPVPAKVEITDEAAIPSQFWTRAEPTINKRAVLQALKEEQVVPGAVLGNGGATVSVTKG